MRLERQVNCQYTIFVELDTGHAAFQGDSTRKAKEEYKLLVPLLLRSLAWN
jgi:hypothetical protein